MMDNYTKWKERYDKVWATKEQLQKLVTLEVLTQEQYENIITPKPPTPPVMNPDVKLSLTD